MTPQEILSHHGNVGLAMWERRWADLVALMDYVEAHGAPDWYLVMGWGKLNRKRLASLAQLQAEGKIAPVRHRALPDQVLKMLDQSAANLKKGIASPPVDLAG